MSKGRTSDTNRLSVGAVCFLVAENFSLRSTQLVIMRTLVQPLVSQLSRDIHRRILTRIQEGLSAGRGW